MSFATSCPSCGTTFRVVRDQLKVSEGWVRCGRCGEVFCALDGLFEIARQDQDAPPHTAAAPADGGRPQVEDSAATPQVVAAPAPDATPPAAPAAVAATVQHEEAPPPVEPEPPQEAGPLPFAAGAVPEPEALGMEREVADTQPSERVQPEPVQPLPEASAAAPVPASAPPPDPAVHIPAAPPEVRAAVPPEPALAPPAAAAVGEDRGGAARREEASLLRRTPSSPLDDDAATSADVLDSRFFEDEDDAHPPWPARRDADQGKEFADARFSSTLGEGDFEPDVREEAAQPAAQAADLRPSMPMPLESEQAAQPGFLKQARREERLRRPAVRAAMAAGAVALGLLLALQVAVQRRDALAAEMPALRPALEAWCRVSGCEIGPLRRIDDVVLDHSALAEAGPGRSGYRLSLLLRNRGDATLALPAVELTLTDTSGQIVARRVLQPAELGSREARIGPRAQLALSIELDTPGRRLTGYTVETFYP